MDVMVAPTARSRRGRGFSLTNDKIGNDNGSCEEGGRFRSSYPSCDERYRPFSSCRLTANRRWYLVMMRSWVCVSETEKHTHSVSSFQPMRDTRTPVVPLEEKGKSMEDVILLCVMQPQAVHRGRMCATWILLPIGRTGQNDETVYFGGWGLMPFPTCHCF
jgi:hypothetical protein